MRNSPIDSKVRSEKKNQIPSIKIKEGDAKISQLLVNFCNFCFSGAIKFIRKSKQFNFVEPLTSNHVIQENLFNIQQECTSFVGSQNVLFVDFIIQTSSSMSPPHQEHSCHTRFYLVQLIKLTQLRLTRLCIK